jgi:hypothetical protein
MNKETDNILLPDWMRVTEEQQKEIESKAKADRERYNLEENLSNKDARILRYAQREEMLAKGILKSQEARNSLSVSELTEENRRLAENLLIQGKFDEALDYAIDVDDELTGRIKRFQSAMEIDDNSFCDCKDTSITDGVRTSLLSRHYIEARIYSPKHNKLMNVMTCKKCRHTNITDYTTGTYKDTYTTVEIPKNGKTKNSNNNRK